MNDPEFIPIKDVPAEMRRLGLPVGLSTVKRLVADGEIGSATIGRRRKAAVRSIRTYVAERLAEAGINADDQHGGAA